LAIGDDGANPTLGVGEDAVLEAGNQSALRGALGRSVKTITPFTTWG
jgi:hypothetical protein